MPIYHRGGVKTVSQHSGSVPCVKINDEEEMGYSGEAGDVGAVPAEDDWNDQ
jgi:hypothetical protein